MMKKALSIAIAFVVFLLAFACSLTVSAEDQTNVWSGDFPPVNDTDGAALTVSGPESVYIGDSFDVTFTWHDIDFGNHRVGSIDLYFYFDARFVEIPEGAVSITELDASVWEYVGTPSVERVLASDGAAMELMKVAIVIPEDYSTTANSLSVTVGFEAVSVGTSEFDWYYAAIAAYADESGAYYAEIANSVDGDEVALEYSVTVMAVEGSATLDTDKDEYEASETVVITAEGDLEGKRIGIADENGKLLATIPAKSGGFTIDDPDWEWEDGCTPEDVAAGDFTIGWTDDAGNWTDEDSNVTITIKEVPDTADGFNSLLVACVFISALTALVATAVDSKRRYNK